MWPSRMARTASQIGSLKSSPSTRTVKNPVMEPRGKLPARSKTRGSRAKTEGVYPFCAGGSPAANPISRWAMASRVTESITRSTLAPWSRKYSAIASEVKLARTRRGAGRSDVATTTTARRMPSVPISCSRKARTSRLRSPTSAITVTSAELRRDMDPSSVLLPTPLPPKIPMRCPQPTGSRLSIARIPVVSGRIMCSRSRGPGGALYRS